MQRSTGGRIAVDAGQSGIRLRWERAGEQLESDVPGILTDQPLMPQSLGQVSVAENSDPVRLQCDDLIDGALQTGDGLVRKAIDEVYIDRGDAEVNKSVFAQFESHKEDIERAFGGTLSWEGLFGKRACRIAYRFPYVGSRNTETDWPIIHEALIEAMIRFESAISPFIPKIKI